MSRSYKKLKFEVAVAFVEEGLETRKQKLPDKIKVLDHKHHIAKVCDSSHLCDKWEEDYNPRCRGKQNPCNKKKHFRLCKHREKAAFEKQLQNILRGDLDD
jgi:hypothetical protein